MTSAFTEESLVFNGLQAIVNPLIVLWLTPEYRKLLKRKEKKKRITYVRIPFAINVRHAHYRSHSPFPTTRREYSEMRLESQFPCPRNPKNPCSVAIVAKCSQLRTFYCSEQRSKINNFPIPFAISTPRFLPRLSCSQNGRDGRLLKRLIYQIIFIHCLFRLNSLVF